MADSKSATITVSGLIEDTAAKLKAREELVEQIAAGRELLRGLDKMGQTSADEKKWIAEAFPPREKKDKDADANGATAE